MKRKTSLPAFQFHSTLIHNLTHARKDLILYIWDQQTMFLELHPSACQLRMVFLNVEPTKENKNNVSSCVKII